MRSKSPERSRRAEAETLRRQDGPEGRFFLRGLRRRDFPVTYQLHFSGRGLYHGLAHHIRERSEKRALLHVQRLFQAFQERTESLLREAFFQRRRLQLPPKIRVGRLESLPAQDPLLLLFPGGQQQADTGRPFPFRQGRPKGLVGTESFLKISAFRHQIQALVPFHRAQHREAGFLFRGHVIDMVHIGIEGDRAAQQPQHYGNEEKSAEQQLPPFGRKADMPVEVQFEGISGPAGRRDEDRQENKHEKDGPHQHHGADEAEVAQGLRLHQQQGGEGGHGGDIAHQQRIHLLCQRTAFVLLVLQMVYIVQRIIDGDADDGAADSQDDDRHAALEKGDEPQGKGRTGADGKEDPEDVREAFITEPEKNTDQDRRQADGQEAVFADADGVFHGHLRAAG